MVPIITLLEFKMAGRKTGPREGGGPWDQSLMREVLRDMGLTEMAHRNSATYVAALPARRMATTRKKVHAVTEGINGQNSAQNPPTFSVRPANLLFGDTCGSSELVLMVNEVSLARVSLKNKVHYWGIIFHDLCVFLGVAIQSARPFLKGFDLNGQSDDASSVEKDVLARVEEIRQVFVTKGIRMKKRV